MNAVINIINGVSTEADMERIQAAMLAWLTDEQGPSLHQRLGLSRRAARCELRNTHLRAAAAYLPQSDPWPRAEQLAESCRAFEVRRWPKWRRSGPPTTASDLDRELFSARQYGDVCMSTRQTFRIITS